LSYEVFRFRDEFESRSSYWSYRVDNFASINVKNGVLEMCVGPTEALYYSNAEIADGEFDNLPWVKGSMEVRLRFTELHYGSAGFGFWNHSMRVDSSYPAWFIYLRAYGPYPLQGFFAQLGNIFQPIMLYSSVTLYKTLLDLLPFIAPIKIVSGKPSAPDLDLRRWNTYRVEWDGVEARYYINGVEVARIASHRRGRARADIWIDNAVFYPPRWDSGGVFRHVTQENRAKSCLEVDYVEIDGYRYKQPPETH